ncbi:glutaredoxin-3 [Parasteatoda tepidariorum]|uniref:Uncharacterized protein n=2 Tax=Parasteatoda tepidariorum TaxID=114398 RepID=A0A2L2YA44_PARTP|nr:glutaredoxin 3 [Parasteatoda tepidariorum]
MEVLSINSDSKLTDVLNQNAERLTVLYFYVEDSAECHQMSDVVTELSKDSRFKDITLGKIEATKCEGIAKRYDVTSAPTFIFISKKSVADKLIGANVPAFSKKLKENLENIQANDSEEDLDTRLKKLINKAPVMLFMKGNPTGPRCGFSKQVIALLNSYNAKYETFDILEDFEVREGLKTFSNWPTYPQLYVKGDLIGGLDILKELSESGELKDILAA